MPRLLSKTTTAAIVVALVHEEKLGKRKERKKFMFIGIFIEFHIPQTNLLTIEINKFSPIFARILSSFFRFMSN